MTAESFYECRFKGQVHYWKALFPGSSPLVTPKEAKIKKHDIEMDLPLNLLKHIHNTSLIISKKSMILKELGNHFMH
jgi:hypothetical protein